jgi:streptomycin 6-kinase
MHWLSEVALGDGSEAVVKIAPGAYGREATFLREACGAGAVRLLAEDAGAGAMLLERVRPGDSLRHLVPRRDAEATAALLAVMERLHPASADASALPPLRGQRRAFDEYLARYPGEVSGPLPPGMVDRARSLFDDLLSEERRAVRLHGDLHHDNVLRSSREPWLAIDPHGLIGDPGYEAGVVLYNPCPDRRDDGLLALVPARVEQLADGMGQAVERIAAWGFVKAVLSEVWTDEDGGTPGGRALDVALLLGRTVAGGRDGS